MMIFDLGEKEGEVIDCNKPATKQGGNRDPIFTLLSDFNLLLKSYSITKCNAVAMHWNVNNVRLDQGHLACRTQLPDQSPLFSLS